MIATGCIMARVCHTNNCPVGVASQKEELRARFSGTPADIVNFFHYVAEEVRAELARLGARSLDEIVGRPDLLTQRSTPLAKTANLDLGFLTTPVPLSENGSLARVRQATHSNGPVLDDDILQARSCQLYVLTSSDNVTAEVRCFGQGLLILYLSCLFYWYATPLRFALQLNQPGCLLICDDGPRLGVFLFYC